MRRILAGLVAALFLLPSIAQSAAAPSYNPPFGLWRTPPELFGTIPFNLSALAFDPAKNSPAELFAALNAARANRMHIFISLVNFGDLQEGYEGFSLANWQARYNAWCPGQRCVDLRSYVADGTLIALHAFEYSSDPDLGSHKTPSLDQIRQVTAYVKTLWPYLPIAIDSSHPCLLAGEPWSRADVDMVLISFVSTRQTNFARGDARFDNNVACARQAGLSYVLVSNPFGGTQQGLAPTGLSAFRHFTEYALLYPGKKATLIWRWWPDNTSAVSNGVQTFGNFWSEQMDPGVGAVMREIERCAANPTPSSCPAGQRGGTAQSNL